MQQKRYILMLVSMLAITLILAACGASSQSSTATLPQVPNSEQNENIAELQNTELVIGNLPTDFPITIYQGAGYQDGDQVLFSEILAQGQPVVLNFWAGLCPPCRLEMPDLQSVSNKYQGQALLFGLDVGPFTGLGTNEDGRALLQELDITYPAGTTTNRNVVREYQILGMPTTYFITPDGNIQETWTGLLTEAKLTELVEELLVASADS